MHALNLDRTSRADHDATRLLDEVIPLKDASHADVVSYAVEAPMRYAECFGVLASGRKIPLQDNRQFVGWSCQCAKRSLLFQNDDVRVEVHVDPDDPVSCDEPGYVREVTVERRDRESKDTETYRKFIGRDGGLLRIPA